MSTWSDMLKKQEKWDHLSSTDAADLYKYYEDRILYLVWKNRYSNDPKIKDHIDELIQKYNEIGEILLWLTSSHT